jgi:two-component sensor histidine kinase/tetratricopeptide (TPR) repeat protein
MTACAPYHHPDFTPRHLGWQADQDLTPYLKTDSVLSSVDRIPGVQAKLDSLLEWTDMLNFSHEAAALTYANELYKLAIEKGYRFTQALGMYYRALLKGRMQIKGEGIDDALADARISLSLLKSSKDPAWLIRSNGLFGHLFYEKSREDIQHNDSLFLDSAFIYLHKALSLSQNSEIPEREVAYLQGQVFLDLGNAYSMRDSSLAISYFQQSIKVLQHPDYIVPLACTWRDLGIFFIDNYDYKNADSAFQKSEQLLRSTSDPTNLIYTYQRIADLKGRQFYDNGLRKDYEESMAYLNACLSLKHKNLYYTYLLIAYNFHADFEIKHGNPIKKYSPEGDSAIKYYQLTLQEVQQDQVIGVMPSLVDNISFLCNMRDSLTGKDCQTLLDGQKSSSFLNNNYRLLVNTIRDDLKNSNTRVRKFEKTELSAASNRRVRNLWLISGGGLLFALLVFLISLQQVQKKRLQAQMRALRAQINPHFISNSLNAIENLVIKNDRQAAAKYLVHFSRLSRKILSSSRDANTSLTDEIQTLKHFLALEQLRFNDKLDFQIVVAEELEPDKIIVPGLILQPYAENAIWHGIKPKSGRGNLTINIEQEHKHLICTIEDDGVGRKKSQELKAKSVLSTQHKSQGMKITEERLKAFAKVKGFKVDIIDLYHPDGEARGTRVVLKLPLKIKKST